MEDQLTLWEDRILFFMGREFDLDQRYDPNTRDGVYVLHPKGYPSFIQRVNVVDVVMLVNKGYIRWEKNVSYSRWKLTDKGKAVNEKRTGSYLY